MNKTEKAFSFKGRAITDVTKTDFTLTIYSKASFYAIIVSWKNIA